MFCFFFSFFNNSQMGYFRCKLCRGTGCVDYSSGGRKKVCPRCHGSREEFRHPDENELLDFWGLFELPL